MHLTEKPYCSDDTGFFYPRSSLSLSLFGDFVLKTLCAAMQVLPFSNRADAP